MHPAPSVILFTTLSGLGFGLLLFLGLGQPDVTGWVAFVFFFIGYALAVGGLMASTFHLGNPQRALKAFSQWRTSWLSREAWLSVAALCVTGIYAIGVIFFGVRLAPFGWLGAALSLATVYATSMIYGQLKTVPRWNTPLTSLLFLVLMLSGGMLLAGMAKPAGWALLVAGIVQVVAWASGDGRLAERGHTMESATGLGSIGKVRLFEGPHTGTSYLMQEMVYVVARKHALKLRSIALLLMSVLPAVLLLAFPAGHLVAGVSVLSHLIGVLVARWLFFAEAEHVVGLYYGKR